MNIYISVITGVILLVVFRWIHNPRLGVLSLLTFTTFSLDAFQWGSIPIQGIATSIQAVSIFLAVSYLFKGNTQTRFLINRYTVMILVLWVSLLAFLLISPAQTYGLHKTVLFLIKCILPIVAFGSLAPFNRKDMQIIFWTVVIASFLMLIDVLFFGDIQSARLTNGSISPITVGRTLGLGGTLISVFMILKEKGGLVSNVFGISGFLALTLGMFLTGSRGPLLSIVITWLCASVFLQRGIKQRLVPPVRICILVSCSMIFYIIASANIIHLASVQRIVQNVSTIGMNHSDLGRISRMTVAWNTFKSTYGLGVGTGGFAALYNGLSDDYPHNVILEVASEQGVIGLFILFTLLIMVILKLSSTSKLLPTDSYGKAILCLWFFSLFNAFVSGDISDNYLLWITGCMAWLLEPGIFIRMKKAENSPIIFRNNNYPGKEYG